MKYYVILLWFYLKYNSFNGIFFQTILQKEKILHVFKQNKHAYQLACNDDFYWQFSSSRWPLNSNKLCLLDKLKIHAAL